VSKDEILDLRGLKCPLPALFTRRRLARAQPGETIVVLTDDPLAPVDVPHMCTQEGYAHVSTLTEGTVSRIVVRRTS
jgi:tRNA 2-thiouridine synthesizing protein A